MPRKTIEFNLDFIINNFNNVCTVKQFDDVDFTITPLNQGISYTVTGSTCKLFVGINEDLFMQTKDISIVDNKIKIKLDKNILQKEGYAYGELELTDTQGTITTSSFMFCISSKIGEGAIIPGLVEGFVEKYEKLMQTFKSEFNDLTSGVQRGETARISSENTRVSNENKRISSENTRIASENTRIKDETTRKSNETLRTSTENTRISNENKRVTSENSRIKDEGIRISSENTRISNENARITNHNKSIENINVKITDVETRFQKLTSGQQQSSEVIDARDNEISLKARLDRDLAKGKIINENVEGNYISVNDSVNGSISNIEILGNTTQDTVDLSDIKSVCELQEDGRYKMSILSSNGKEKGDVLYQENKSSILLPCQLEKVGDVSDRLFRREDGIWCIEKNIITQHLKECETGNYNNFACRFYMDTPSNNDYNYNTIQFLTNLDYTHTNINYQWNNRKTNSIAINNININEILSCICDITMEEYNYQTVIDLVKNNDIWVKFILKTPQIIELPLDTQIALNSFNGVTNIFTEDTVIEPAIKATVPKSLGASVNSLVNKTDILSDRVEAVEKLKEGTELEVSTESGYVVCENTNNGQIEELKIEGKTLVNLLQKTATNNSGTLKRLLNRPLSKFTVVRGNKNQNVLLSKYSSEGSWVGNIGVGTDNAVQYYELKNGEYISAIVASVGTDSTQAQYSDITAFSNVEVIILEGNHTSNPPAYFEGLKSVGDGVDKIEVLSCGKNLFTTWEQGAINGEGNDVASSTDVRSGFINIKPNTEYVCSNNGVARSTVIYYYDKNKKYISKNDSSSRGTTPSNAYYVRLAGATSDRNYFQLEEGTTITPYTPPQGNKKQILYQTKEGVLEKPILRSVENVSDTIEKHSDGKYYYHKRCEATLLNGSENGWTKSATITGRYYIDNLFKTIVNPTVKLCISNKYTSLSANESDTGLKGIACTNGNKLMINTSFDTLELFKSDLQTNNATVVYQLATEEVYECVNLDLDSYEGETSIIFDGGAISPKLTFKIASHIGNTISVLKDRINYLEDKVISMFKSVLAGDVQTLAYELYPEDFKDEIIEEETIEGAELL